MNVKGTRTKVHGGPTFIYQCTQLGNPPMNVKGTLTKVYRGLTVMSPIYIYQCTQLRNPPMNEKGIRTNCIGAQQLLY